VTSTTPVLPAFAELLLGGALLGSFGTVVAGIYLMVRLNRRAR
jgi:hypothetical protein